MKTIGIAVLLFLLLPVAAFAEEPRAEAEEPAAEKAKEPNAKEPEAKKPEAAQADPAPDKAGEPKAREPAAEEVGAKKAEADEPKAEGKKDDFRPKAAPPAPKAAMEPTQVKPGEKYAEWLKRFKLRNAWAAERHRALRQKVLEAKARWDQDKGNKVAYRDYLVAQRQFHNFWYRFRGWQIWLSRKNVQRWQRRRRRHRTLRQRLKRKIMSISRDIRQEVLKREVDVRKRMDDN